MATAQNHLCIWSSVLIFSLVLILHTTALAQGPGTDISQLPGYEKIASQIKASMTDYLLDYSDHTGYLHFEAEGNAGSIIQMHLYYYGFYIRPNLTLSRSKQGLYPYSSEYQDVYDIIPKSFAANIRVNSKKYCKGDGSEKMETFTAHLSETFNLPDPPVSQTEVLKEGVYQLDQRLTNWLYRQRSQFHNDKVRTSFRIISRQADGGDAHLMMDAYSVIQGTLLQPWKVPPASDRHCKIFFGTGNQTEHVALTLNKLTWKLPENISIEKMFSLEDVSLSYTGTTKVSYGCPGFETTLSDTEFTIRYRFAMTPKMTIDAILTASDTNEESWEPTPGETRTFQLKLNDPGPEGISGLRFVLEGTSTHPGIALNAGNHLLANNRTGDCPDCKIPGLKKAVPWQSTTFLKSHQENVYTVNRSYTHYNSCPIDALPDIYFVETDNPGWEAEKETLSENLNYTMTQSIIRDKVDADMYTVQVRIMDGAASARLRAYVNVGGFWYEARAEGPTADDTHTALMLPLDKDGDGIRDGWERQWGVDDPADDADSLLGNPHPGDGVTVFEEYRGIYAEGRHHRMSPVYKDIFIHDYSGYFNPDLRSVARKFRNQELSLWILESDEFKNDMINFQDSHYKNGDQYILVTMSLTQCPGLDLGWAGGLAAHLGPPLREANTLVIKYAPGSLAQALGMTESRTLAGTLAHEIGHNINVSHHGENDRIRVIDGQDTWIACKGGQHSGVDNCIMKYNCARYFINLDFVPQTVLGQYLAGESLTEYTEPYGTQTFFCKDPGDGAQTGPAARGNCLGQIHVKSY